MLKGLTTIIGLISAGRAFTETPMYHRLISGLVALAALVVVSSMVVGALLIGLFYWIYLAFMSHGLESTPALLATLGIGLLALTLLVLATLHYMRSAFDLTRLMGQPQFPIVDKVGGVAHAFIDGVLGRATYR